jgi:hypothetical protein
MRGISIMIIKQHTYQVSAQSRAISVCF